MLYHDAEMRSAMAKARRELAHRQTIQGERVPVG
jgi:hypothetical protein